MNSEQNVNRENSPKFPCAYPHAVPSQFLGTVSGVDVYIEVGDNVVGRRMAYLAWGPQGWAYIGGNFPNDFAEQAFIRSHPELEPAIQFAVAALNLYS